MSIKTTLSAALACLGVGLAAGPSHAQGLLVFNTNVLPTFSATLGALGGPSSVVNINATDAGNGQSYFAGQFGFNNDATGQYFQVLDLTQPSTPGQPLVPQNNVVTSLDFLGLDLTATYADSTTQHFDLLDPFDPTQPANTLIEGQSAAGLDYLQTNAVAPTDASGAALLSATVTGTFSDEATPAGQPIPVQVATVPEPAAPTLLLAGLALAAAPRLRARRGRARS